MARYLLLDLGGVLTGIIVQRAFEHDLVLEQYSTECQLVLPNGQLVLKLLTQLTQQGYQLIFHSNYPLDRQLGILKQLQTAASGYSFPTPHAIALNSMQSADLTEIPIIRASVGLHKIPLRRALELYLDIIPINRKDHVVIDDDLAIIQCAAQEWYRALHADSLTLSQALTQLI